MRRRTLMVTTTLLLSAPAAGLALFACSSGSSSGTPAGTDAGPHSDATSADSPNTADHHTGGGDSAQGNDAPQSSDSPTGDADAGPVGKMHFMALNNLLPVPSNVRYCFAATATGDPGLANAVAMSPTPAAPGLAPGLLSTIQVPASIVGNAVRVFVYYTTSLDSFGLEGADCPTLFKSSVLTASGDGGTADAGSPASDGGAQLLQTLDFDVSDTIPSATFTASAPYLILSTGCPLSSNPTFDPSYCGTPVDAGGVGTFFGDFHVFALGLDATQPAAGKANLQAVNATVVNNYYQTQTPWAYDFGVTYGTSGIPDGGPLPDGASPFTLIGGPEDGGPNDFGYPSEIGNGPLYPPTAITSLGTVSNAVAVVSAWTPPGQTPFPLAGYQLFPIDPILQLSNLTQADLNTGTTFTLVLLGDNFAPATTADGGPGPLFWNFRLIRNDQL